MASKIAKVLWSETLRKAVAEVGTEAAKSAIGEATKEFIKRSTSAAVQTIVSGASTALAGATVGPILRVLLRVSDEVSRKLDKVSAKLDKQLHAAFDTGVREAIRSLRLPSSRPEAATFRNQRLTFAIDELERAWTLSLGLPTEGRDRFVIRLLQGFCSIGIPGGVHYASAQFQECIGWLKQQMQQGIEELAKMKTKMADLKDRAWVPPLPGTVGSPFPASMRTIDNWTNYAAGKAGPRRELERLREHHDKLCRRQSAVEKLLNVIEMLLNSIS